MKTTTYYSMPVQVDGYLRDVVELAAGSPTDRIEAAAKASEKVQKFIKGKEILKVVIVPRKLVNIIISAPATSFQCDHCCKSVKTFEGRQVLVEYRSANPAITKPQYPHNFAFCSVECLVKEMSPRNEYDDAHDWRTVLRPNARTVALEEDWCA